MSGRFVRRPITSRANEATRQTRLTHSQPLGRSPCRSIAQRTPAMTVMKFTCDTKTGPAGRTISKYR
jgi:hypothetical protein